MEILRKNLTLLLVGLITFVFGVIAITTAIRLYQTAQDKSNIPQSTSAITTACNTLAFTLLAQSTLTGTPGPATPSSTPAPRITSSPRATATPTTKPTATPTQPKATPTVMPPLLPEVGFSFPAVGGILAGTILLGLALLLRTF